MEMDEVKGRIDKLMDKMRGDASKAPMTELELRHCATIAVLDEYGIGDKYARDEPDGPGETGQEMDGLDRLAVACILIKEAADDHYDNFGAADSDGRTVYDKAHTHILFLLNAVYHVGYQDGASES